MIVSINRLKPILRWAGGKLWMIDHIKDYLPVKFGDYYEPFIGGASVYLNIICNNKSYISDFNPELICFYNQVKSNLINLITLTHNYNNNVDEYYRIRSINPKTELEIAARFYYLNRACFNGLYRVNLSGGFNVPYGHRDIKIADIEGLKLLSQRLQNTEISCSDFEIALKNIKEGDFIFLDPPYTVAHNINGFIEYNQHIFSWEDQQRLASCVEEIINKKAYFLMTNAYHNSIKKLYIGIGKHFEIERFSTISANVNSRNKISELLITNCI
jgi:DNA adenine methylase